MQILKNGTTPSSPVYIHRQKSWEIVTWKFLSVLTEQKQFFGIWEGIKFQMVILEVQNFQFLAESVKLEYNLQN